MNNISTSTLNRTQPIDLTTLESRGPETLPEVVLPDPRRAWRNEILTDIAAREHERLLRMEGLDYADALGGRLFDDDGDPVSMEERDYLAHLDLLEQSRYWGRRGL